MIIDDKKTCARCKYVDKDNAGWRCTHPGGFNPVTGDYERGLVQWVRALFCIDGRFFEPMFIEVEIEPQGAYVELKNGR